MIEKLGAQIRENMETKSTEELLGIWKENDREQWSEEAFEAIKQLLLERGETLPDQKEKLKKTEQNQEPSKLKKAFGFLLILMSGFFFYGALTTITVIAVLDPGPGNSVSAGVIASVILLLFFGATTFHYGIQFRPKSNIFIGVIFLFIGVLFLFYPLSTFGNSLPDIQMAALSNVFLIEGIVLLVVGLLLIFTERRKNEC
jgi:uncharacterized membrane protein YgcG